MALNCFLFIGLVSIVSRGGVSSDSSGELSKLECGLTATRRPKNEQTSTVASTLGSSPWHVAIYDVPKNPNVKWRLLCGGSILSPSIVVTAASCVFIEGVRVLMNETSIRVVAGKIHISLDVDPENAQLREVKSISAPQTFVGEITGFSENIAVLHVDPPFFQSDYIAPVCIDWNGAVAKIEPQLRQLTKVVEVSSWGLAGRNNPSGLLQEGAFDTEDNRQCRASHKREQILRYINYDKFCFLTPGGRIKEDAGSGVVVKLNGKYYLTGIVSTFLDQRFSLATNLSKHGKWLMNTVSRINDEIKCKEGFACKNHACVPLSKKCNGQIDCADGSDEDEELCAEIRDTSTFNKDGCTLPLQLSGVSYRIENCDEERSCVRLAGTTVSNGQTVRMTCGRGTIHSSKGPRYACLGGQWFQERPICIKMCLPRRKPGVNTKCEHNGIAANCNDYMKPGSSVTAQCKRLHRAKDNVLIPEKASCQEDGEWTSELPTCTPICGKPNPISDAVLTISNGHNATYGRYPWHVALYIRNDTTSTWQQSCGGTIIAINMVITAAHCVHDIITGKLISANTVMIAGGKVKREMTTVEIHQQSVRVKELIVPKGYEGFPTQYEYDLALLYLATPFNITDFVLPCCIDLTASTPSLPKTEGIVVGWGYTEKDLQLGIRGTPSAHLLETTLPIISNFDCRALDSTFIPFLTFDKICGVYKEDSGPQKGDSGGGLVAVQGDLHFLIGVVSIKPTFSNKFGAFTNVAAHKSWIVKMLQTHP